MLFSSVVIKQLPTKESGLQIAGGEAFQRKVLKGRLKDHSRRLRSGASSEREGSGLQSCEAKLEHCEVPRAPLLYDSHAPPRTAWEVTRAQEMLLVSAFRAGAVFPMFEARDYRILCSDLPGPALLRAIAATEYAPCPWISFI